MKESKKKKKRGVAARKECREVRQIGNLDLLMLRFSAGVRGLDRTPSSLAGSLCRVGLAAAFSPTCLGCARTGHLPYP
jgi:hypothetical protein